ncbi:hypothetical protein [Turicibacter sanguinis]|jgi:hypothetical protein|uniref:hypothetical protein n=1 Tax=Turicibacter sanguinis TaxID=154288 RepID=UPI00325B3F98
MKKNVKKEINDVVSMYLGDIQANFINGELNDEAKKLVTICTNECLNLVRRCKNDYRELECETFYYNDKNLDIFHEKEIISYISSKIYMQLSDLRKAPNEFLAISSGDDEALYNFKRHDTRRFVRYVDMLDGDEEVSLQITVSELYSICTRKSVDFEDLFLWYVDRFEDCLLNVVKEVFDEKFYRISKEDQQFLLEWTKEQLYTRCHTNIQIEKVEQFFSQRVRYTDSKRSMQMILHKICNN